VPLQKPRFSEGIETLVKSTPFKYWDRRLAEAPFFIPPQSAPILGAGGMSTVPVARGAKKDKRQKKKDKRELNLGFGL